MANDTACDGHIYLYMVIWEVNGSFKETASKTPKRGFWFARPKHLHKDNQIFYGFVYID